jgi:hypothetical protein
VHRTLPKANPLAVLEGDAKHCGWEPKKLSFRSRTRDAEAIEEQRWSHYSLDKLPFTLKHQIGFLTMGFSDHSHGTQVGVVYFL